MKRRLLRECIDFIPLRSVPVVLSFHGFLFSLSTEPESKKKCFLYQLEKEILEYLKHLYILNLSSANLVSAEAR